VAAKHAVKSSVENATPAALTFRHYSEIGRKLAGLPA
jgi:hypothetical protein